MRARPAVPAGSGVGRSPPISPFTFLALCFFVAMACAVAVAVLTRGWLRALFWTLAALLAVPSVLVVPFGLDDLRQWAHRREAAAENARRQTVLAEDTVLDGVALPAGTHMLWYDTEHTLLMEAEPRRPVEVFGVRAKWVDRPLDGSRWLPMPDGPQTVEGWPCAAEPVSLFPDGRLAACTLDRAVEWHGWTLPAGTHVNPYPVSGGPGLAFRRKPDNGPGSDSGQWYLWAPPEDGSADPHPSAGKLGLFFNRDAPDVPETGRARSVTSLNGDGSLDGAHVIGDEPLPPIGGVALSGEVRWRYDPATFGQGRRRPPVAVEGRTGQGRKVVVRLPEGTIVRE